MHALQKTEDQVVGDVVNEVLTFCKTDGFRINSTAAKEMLRGIAIGLTLSGRIVAGETVSHFVGMPRKELAESFTALLWRAGLGRHVDADEIPE